MPCQPYEDILCSVREPQRQTEMPQCVKPALFTCTNAVVSSRVGPLCEGEEELATDDATLRVDLKILCNLQGLVCHFNKGQRKELISLIKSYPLF